MTFWRNFVDSISSRGGSILILLVITTALGIMVLRHGQDTGEAASLIRNSFSGFAGALLMALTTTSKANGNGNGKTPDPTTLPGGSSHQGETK
jgi:hypothetical protein